MNLGKKINLGKRLQQIESMVTEPYDHIWDCCCDHGLLGAALLSRQAAGHIHFVDVVPELMRELENKLQQFCPRIPESNSQWQLHCMDVSTLPLSEFGGKHLVIIAGVGGDLMNEFVKAIYQKNPLIDIDFLLCPVQHQFTLRQRLIQLDFSLKTESLMIENKRFYEVLLVSTVKNTNAKIYPAGSLIWQSNTPEQAKIAAGYLEKTLAHYQRMQLNQNKEVKCVIDAYRAVAISHL